jgi:hypothetical protein
VAGEASGTLGTSAGEDVGTLGTETGEVAGTLGTGSGSVGAGSVGAGRGAKPGGTAGVGSKSFPKRVAIWRSSTCSVWESRDVGALGIGCDGASRRSRTLAWMRSTGDAVGMETLEGNQESVSETRPARALPKSTRGGSGSGSELGPSASHRRHVLPRCLEQQVSCGGERGCQGELVMYGCSQKRHGAGRRQRPWD